MSYSCTPGVIWFADDYRCHCNRKNELICVNRFQKELEGKPCDDDVVAFDSFVICECREGKTACDSLTGVASTIAGYCEEGEDIMENCYKCTCTRSLFRRCVFVEDCLNPKAKKPGKCLHVESLYNLAESIFCLELRKQECISDYGCPGDKICCLVTDCYYRCMDPIPFI
ncbi:uncharacterized protein LOC109608872 isoform X2 [Aethina tumida]|nr:uncharacterized protein LOC109608872 isoform X2 [Aethina tumida]XP_049818307.1 uncharacterized protein LOC109608872 isoform X2 [Aethina tumida]XP_049818308.1 uncharacterized protein LOC109608872 isoform X2 [Aethina tumida]